MVLKAEMSSETDEFIREWVRIEGRKDLKLSMDTLTLRSIQVQGGGKTSKEHWKVTARKEKPAENDGQVCILTDDYHNVEVINNLEINIFMNRSREIKMFGEV